MKAVRLHAFGDQPVIDDIPEPESAVGEVLVNVLVAAVNPLDLWVIEGSVANRSQPLPFVLGVEAVATRSGRRYIVGGFGLGSVRDGLFRERASVPEGALWPIPDGVDDTQAAGTTVVGVTAKRIVDVAEVVPGETVIVLGASGGVGAVAVQVAKRVGARVIAVTSSAAKRAGLLALGADAVVVTSAGTLVEDTQKALDGPAHVVLNPLAGNWVMAAANLLAPGGRQVLFGRSESDSVEFSAGALYRKNISILGFGGLADPPVRAGRRETRVLDEIAPGASASRSTERATARPSRRCIPEIAGQTGVWEAPPARPAADRRG